jgi:DNA-binding transcriptional ArsR family regulator
LNNGWIYKKAEELSEELMLGASPATIGRHIKVLLENKWLEQRQNPKYKWDQTKQYRVNLNKIIVDLLKLGYILQDYKVDLSFFILKNADFILKNEDSILKNPGFNLKNRIVENEKAIPEITYRDYNKEKNINEFNNKPFPFWNWLENESME